MVSSQSQSLPTSIDETMALLWVLNLADGRHSLIDIAERSGLPFPQIIEAAGRLREHDLLRPA